MKILAATILCLTLLSPAFSQHKNFSKEHEIWLDGYAYLATGEKVKGKINYNFVSETIRVNSNGKIKTCPAKNVNRFVVYDKIRNKSQYFSFPLTQEENSEFLNPKLRVRDVKKSYHFFLVKHQNAKGALLSNLDIDYGDSRPNNYTDANGNTQQYYNSSQNSPGYLSPYEKSLERIYILDKRGIPLFILEGKIEKKITSKIDPFYSFRKYESTNFDVESVESSDITESKNVKSVKKYKLKNKDFLEDLDPRNYRKLEAYIENEGIEIKTTEGLIQVIDYWSEI